MNVLITGTNRGFGRLTALALAGRGHSVLATMREPGGKNQAAATELGKAAGITVLELDLTSDAETYRMELKPTGVEVAIVQPGAFPTAFNQQAVLGADAGQRPARVSVDRFNGQGTAALNAAHAEVQRALLGGMGMPFLAD